MLGLAERVAPRFLLTSTSEVCWRPLEHPQKEEYWGHVDPIGELYHSVETGTPGSQLAVFRYTTWLSLCHCQWLCLCVTVSLFLGVRQGTPGAPRKGSSGGHVNPIGWVLTVSLYHCATVSL